MIEMDNGSQLSNGAAKMMVYCQDKKSWPNRHVMGSTFSKDRKMQVKVYSVGRRRDCWKV